MWILMWIVLDFDPRWGEWDHLARHEIRIENEYPNAETCERQLTEIGLNANMEIVRDGLRDIVAKKYSSDDRLSVLRCEKIGILKFNDKTWSVSPETR